MILPADLPDDVHDVWHQVVSELGDRIADSTLEVVRAYCFAVRAHREASDNVARLGVLVKGSTGPMVNPLLKVQSDALSDMLGLRSALGLGSRFVGSGGANRAALEQMISALSDLGRVAPVDAAVVAAARALADAVDAAPDHASLWLQYQRALKSLETLNAQTEDDAFEKLLDQLRAPVGDEEKPKSRKSRAKHSEDR